MQQVVGPFALVGLIFLGIALLWARQVAYRNRTAERQDVVRLVLSITGSLLILVGVLGAAIHVMYLLAPIGAVFILGVVLMLVLRFRSIERRTLLQCISIAASKGIPIPQAVRSFGKERSDELGYRAFILAEALEAGISLPDALAYSKTNLPTDALLAMRLGHETGTLPQAIQRIARADDPLSTIARWTFEKYLYLGTLVMAMVIVITFFMVKIMPVFQRMFLEFDVSLPTLTMVNMQVAEVIANYWFLSLPFLFVVGIVLGLSGLNYLGFLPRDFPGSSIASLRFDATLIMRALALAISCGWPMNKTVWLLARIYPRSGIRHRLAASGRHIDNGVDWCDALRRTRIFTGTDWAVLKAAQRAGNIEWALDEMADSSSRRLLYRARLVLNIAFPLTLLVFGGFVAFFVVGFFLPLANLIEALT